MRRTLKFENISIIFILLILSMLFLAPSFWTTLTSFKSPRDIFLMPPKLAFKATLDNYRELFSDRFEGGSILTIFLPNSLITAMLSTGLTLIVSVLAGYSLARFRYAGRKAIGFSILATRMLPPIGVAIPLYLMMTKLRLVDSRLSLILAYTALNIPMATWILKGFIENIPKELEESARIDGCSMLTILTRIIIPLITPGLASVAILAFILSWNDFALALFLTSIRAKTLPISLASFKTEQGIAWGAMCGMGTIMSLPVILFAIFTQKYLVKGLTMGAVK